MVRKHPVRFFQQSAPGGAVEPLASGREMLVGPHKRLGQILIRKAFEHKNTTTFSNHDPITVHIKRT